MSNPYFRFKRFTVWHDQCAMKVGTDGVLIGAWTPIRDEWQSANGECVRVLDIGTGSGLIALMIAQRCAGADIDAIEIDEQAAKQAAENCTASPWAERLHVSCAALQDWEGEYDLIVSNPPYFVNALKAPEQGRKKARHTDSLSYEELMEHSARLLKDEGQLCVILPAEEETNICRIGKTYGLYADQIVRVSSKTGKSPKRVMIAYEKKEVLPKESTFIIEAEDSPRSEEYKRLTQDFYL